jgi:Arc/MetJ-type ribon-helix-helix transcriptional regulator
MSKWQNIRLPKNLYEEVKTQVEKRGLWTNEQEFVREAIREKISKVVECKQEA